MDFWTSCFRLKDDTLLQTMFLCLFLFLFLSLFFSFLFFFFFFLLLLLLLLLLHSIPYWDFSPIAIIVWVARETERQYSRCTSCLSSGSSSFFCTCRSVELCIVKGLPIGGKYSLQTTGKPALNNFSAIYNEPADSQSFLA